MDVQVKEALGRVAGWSLLTLLCGAISWFVVGFVMWNWQIADWDIFIRCILVVMTSLLMIMYGATDAWKK